MYSDSSQQRWVDFSEKHTAYCQRSIEDIVGRLNYMRNYSKGKSVEIEFNIASGKVELYVEKSLTAEVYMDGDSGFPSCIVVVNYRSNGLTDREITEFRCVRDPRSCFEFYMFDFEVVDK